MSAPGGVIVQADALRALVRAVVSRGGSGEREASLVAHNLVEANLTGHDSHGVGMLPRYVDNLRAGGLKANQSLRIASDQGSLLTLDGCAGYGQVMGHDAMVLGIERARAHGVAVLGLHNAHHIGRIGHWAEQCLDAGLVSIHFVNVISEPIVAPFGGSDGRFVTNPMCVGIPVQGRAPVVLDFATSRVAMGKVRVAYNKGETVAPGILIDDQGQPTQDPGVMFREPHGALLPFGDHKGYGLALACEILGGALSGGITLQGKPSPHAIINNMVSFIVDADRLGGASHLATQARAFADWVLASPPAAGAPVMLPGDPERQWRRQRGADGIPIDAATWAQLLQAGRHVGLDDAAVLALAAPRPAAA
ncbi:MAG: malate/lactate/ureidoglycolate dehydrogenase [Rubrivivax sp.]